MHSGQILEILVSATSDRDCKKSDSQPELYPGCQVPPFSPYSQVSVLHLLHK